MNQSFRAIILSFVALASLLLSGCGPEVPARFNLDESKTIAVLPAEDPDFARGYFESPRGMDIATHASTVLTREFSEDFVLPPTKYMKVFDEIVEKYYDPRRPIYAAGDDGIKDPADLSRQEIADKLDVDYVVFVQIQRNTWRTRPVESFNLLKGSCVLTVDVYDCQGLQLKHLGTESIGARFPVDQFNRDGVTSFDANDTKIEIGLRRSSGVKIARLFFDHDKDDSYRLRFD